MDINYEVAFNLLSKINEEDRIIIKQLEDENEKLKDLFGKIDRWCKAYPITIFPEPDFKKANKVLKENNISLSAISASNMRHVVNGISGLIQKALEGKDEQHGTDLGKDDLVRHV